MNDQRRETGGMAPEGAGFPVVLPGQLRECQGHVFDNIKRHIDGGGGECDLRIMVLGTAGTRKSFLVYAHPTS